MPRTDGPARPGGQPAAAGSVDHRAKSGAASSDALPFERLVEVFGVGGNGTGFEVGAMLNALNVYRPALCAEPLRGQLVTRVKDKVLVERICDPALNGPLPGASAPELGALLKQFTAKKTGS